MAKRNINRVAETCGHKTRLREINGVLPPACLNRTAEIRQHCDKFFRERGLDYSWKGCNSPHVEAYLGTTDETERLSQEELWELL